MKNLIILIFVALIIFTCNTLYSQKYVALTFDDAPDSFYTAKILDILEEANVKATFFLLGRKVVKYPEIVKRIDREGHLIGNHSIAHRNFTEYKDDSSVLNDVSFVDSVLFSTIGKKPLYFRPPYGALKENQKLLLEQNGYEIAMWTLSTKDWDVFNITKDDIIDSVKENIHPNAIILMHSKDASGNIEDYPYRDNTIEALPYVIKFLKENNYQLVTLDKISSINRKKTFIENNIAVKEDIIFFGDFNENFNTASWESNWGIKWTVRTNESKIITNGFNGENSLRVSYPVGGVGPSETGTQFPIVFDDIPKLEKGFYEELYLRYYVKFEEGFDFRKGGKLPGLMGGGDSWLRSGGNQPDGANGWTLRFMWVDAGKIIVYAYLPPSKNGKWGGETWGQAIDCNFSVKPGKWHLIGQYVNVGTPNKDNGKLIVWIDGIERVNISNMRFGDVENNDGKIGGIYFSTFHGGNTQDWAPLNNSYAQFAQFIVTKNRVEIIEADK